MHFVISGYVSQEIIVAYFDLQLFFYFIPSYKIITAVTKREEKKTNSFTILLLVLSVKYHGNIKGINEILLALIILFHKNANGARFCCLVAQ